MQPKKPSSDQQVFNFSDMSKDMREYTSQFFSTSDFKNLSLVSKEFHRLAHGRLFWEKAVNKHFPGELMKIKAEINLDWASAFQTLEKNFCRDNERARTILYLIKEGDIEKLRKLSMNIDDVHTLNIFFSHYSLFSEIAATKNQKLLDYFYEIAITWFNAGDKKHPIQGRIYKDGSTLLVWAILCKQPIANIAALIQAGFNVNQFADCDIGPVYAAAHIGYLECLSLLLSHDANIHEKCGDDARTPIDAAAISGRLDCMNCLLDHGAEISGVFVHAAGAGKLESLKLLISRGAELFEHSNRDLNHAAMMAAKNGRTECLRYLIELGADVNHANEHGDKDTLLHLAADKNHVDCIELLIANKANIEAKDKFHYTPLNRATENTQLEAMQALITHGANINDEDIRLFEPLIMMLRRPNINMPCLKLLVEHGANINGTIGIYNNCTVLGLAAIDKCTDALEYLISKGASVNPAAMKSPLHSAVIAENLNAVLALIAHDANMDTIDPKNGMSPLMLAAAKDLDSCVEALLVAGASVNLTGKYNGTALFYAVWKGNLRCVDLLLAHEADAEIPFVATKLVMRELSDDSEYGDIFLKKYNLMKDDELYLITPIQMAELLGKSQIVKALNTANDTNRKYLRF